MVKTILTMIVASFMLVAGAIYEETFVFRQFNEFHSVVEQVYEKVDDKTATEDDVYAMQANWLDKKRYLHMFIPHNEIKEIDLWTAETIKLVRDKKWEDAISKIEVIKELSEQIPKTFRVSFDNIL